MNKSKITKLTPEQEEIISITKKEWIKIGLDTKSGNKEAIISAIISIYSNLGLQPPAKIEWLDPKTILRQSMYFNFTYYPEQDSPINANYYNFKIIYAIKETIDKFLDKNLQINLYNLITKPVNEAVHNSLWSSIILRVMDEVEYNFEASLDDSDLRCVGDGESGFFHFYDYYLSNYLFGIFAYYDYLDFIDLPIPNIKEWLILAQNSWQWQLYKDTAKLVIRPEINLDLEQRLHNIGKPAVIFENYNLYYHHGKKLSEKYGQLEPKDWQFKWLAISPAPYIKDILVKETNIKEQELDRKIEIEKEKIFAKIPEYKNKYEIAAYSSARINRRKAFQVIKAAYSLVLKNNYFTDQKIPYTHICSSPLAAYQIIINLYKKGFIHKLMNNYIVSCLIGRVLNHIRTKPEKIFGELEKQFNLKIYKREINKYSKIEKNSIFNSIKKLLNEKNETKILNHEIFLNPEDLSFELTLFKFYLQELNTNLEPQFIERISLLEDLVDNCGWLFCFENLCIVCDRPNKIFLDERKRIHNIGSPAIEFLDGYHFYAHHGEIIPQRYGKIDPSQWSIEWISRESTDHLKQLLIKEIGWKRIVRECDIQIIDKQERHELLNIQPKNSPFSSSFNLLVDINNDDVTSSFTVIDSNINTVKTALISRPWEIIPF